MLGWVLAVAACCALLAGSAVWIGALAAAKLFGNGEFDASIIDAVHAIEGLASRPGNPAAAWGPRGSGLPGPVAYWSTTLVVWALLFSAIVAVGTHWRRRRTLGPLGVKGDRGLAKPRDLAALIVNGPTKGRLTLGKVGHRTIAAEPQTSLAVVGPTGCGKTIGFAIPNLLEWDGPVIATSVKGDLLDATIAARAQRGKVWIYDPTNITGHPADGWSPLAACHEWSGAMRVAAWLCEAAQPRIDSVNDGDYWYTQARKALAPHLHAAAVGHKTIADVVRWIDTQEQDQVRTHLEHAAGIDDTIESMLAGPDAERWRARLHEQEERSQIDAYAQAFNASATGRHDTLPKDFKDWPVDAINEVGNRVEAALNAAISDRFREVVVRGARATGILDPLLAAEALWGKEERLRSSVYATVENVLAGYADPGVAANAIENDIDLAEWLSGPNTIYVCASSHEQARLRPVLTVLIQQAIRSAYDAANRRGGTLDHPCLVLLDEAGNIAPLKDLPGYASTARSHGITFVTIWQDLAQIKSIYGNRAHTVLNNHLAKLFGAGIADDATLEYVSLLVGEAPTTNVNLSGDLHGARRSVSEHTTYRRVAPIDELRRMRRGSGLLIYGSHAPARVDLRSDPARRGRPVRHRNTGIRRSVGPHG
jgi:type IV secretion system protein VirD4